MQIAKVFVINQHEELLLVRRSKTAPRRALTWDLPGGFLEAGESAEQAVFRELSEETGIKTGDISKAQVNQDERDDGIVTRYFFVVEVNDPTIVLSYEHDKYIWVRLDAFEQYVTYEPLIIGFKQLFDHSGA